MWYVQMFMLIFWPPYDQFKTWTFATTFVLRSCICQTKNKIATLIAVCNIANLVKTGCGLSRRLWLTDKGKTLQKSKFEWYQCRLQFLSYLDKKWTSYSRFATRYVILGHPVCRRDQIMVFMNIFVNFRYFKLSIEIRWSGKNRLAEPDRISRKMPDHRTGPDLRSGRLLAHERSKQKMSAHER